MARRNTLTLLAATMLGTIDSNALVPIIALYAKAVGSDLLQIGIIVGLFSAVHAPANLFFGRIADRFGRKLPLQVGLAWDAVSLFLYSVATTPLLVARTEGPRDGDLWDGPRLRRRHRIRDGGTDCGP